MEDFLEKLNKQQEAIEQLRQEFLASRKSGNELPEVGMDGLYFYPYVNRENGIRWSSLNRLKHDPAATNLCITESEHEQFGQIQLNLYEAIAEQTRLLFHCGIADEDAESWTIWKNHEIELYAGAKQCCPPFATKEAAELALSMASNNLKAFWDGSIWYRNEVIK